MFILRTKSIIKCDVDVIVPSSLGVHPHDLPVQFCIKTSWKHGKQNNYVQVSRNWTIDERGKTNDRLERILTITPNKLFCENISITIQDIVEYEDFFISVTVNSVNVNVLAEGMMTVERRIPFVFNCGSKPCFPKLSLMAQSET